jgi:nitrogen fixation/metabolism regulation signal transduction histidine kinase
MKRKPSLLTGWWDRLDLQVRLFLVFTMLFSFSVLCISSFLRNVIEINNINDRAQTTFERNRKIYRLQSVLQEYEQALNDYENNGLPMAEERLYSKAGQIDEMVTDLLGELPADLQPSLNLFAQQKAELTGIIEQLVTAVNQQDRAQVKQWDDQAYNLIKPMYAEIEQITSAGVTELDIIQAEADSLNAFMWLSVGAALFIYSILATITALVLTFQINQPLETLTQAAKDLLVGRYKNEDLSHLIGRRDDVGGMTREFVHVADTINQRMIELNQEADEIRVKIR